ncbi:MAG TPA: hypothetical protein VN376_09605 [Longilinea sp.]|nr:hypothetical protein [Longilinea sp.]
MEDTLILIWQAQQAAEHGDKVTARNLLRQALHLDPNSGLAWEWMARLAAEPEQRRYCLERLLALEPKNPFGLEQQLSEPYNPLPEINHSEQTRDMTMQVEETQSTVIEPEPLPEPAPISSSQPGEGSVPSHSKAPVTQNTAMPSSAARTVSHNPAKERWMSVLSWLIVILILAGVLAFMAYQYFPEWFIRGDHSSQILFVGFNI